MADRNNVLVEIQQVTGLNTDSLMVLPATLEQRQEVASIMIERYLERAAQDTRQFVALPPFLADQLMENGDWEVSAAGVLLAMRRAGELRSAGIDTTTSLGGNQ